MTKVKKLPPSLKEDLAAKNEARRLNGITEIAIKVRTCLACGYQFESLGNRTCGCTRGSNR